MQPLPKLGPWATELEALLEANGHKARRERLTMVRVFEELQGLGYRGGYDAVRRYAASWYRERSLATASAYLAPWIDRSHHLRITLQGLTSARHLPPQCFGARANSHRHAPRSVAVSCTRM